MNFRVVGIDKEISEKVRATLKSPQYGHQAYVEIANGYGPCRSCLKTFKTGEEKRILFTYNAFEGLSNLPLPSPIYIHSEDCKLFDSCSFPKDLRDLPLLFEGFADESEMILRKPATKNALEKDIEEVFEIENVQYINIRNAEAGCFVARIERS